MDCIDTLGDIDIDFESKDENLYDEIAMRKIMDIIYEKTKRNNDFIVLYDLAAAQMLSIDREVGLCILLSYDYFKYFFLLWTTFENIDTIINKTECYIELKKKLS